MHSSILRPGAAALSTALLLSLVGCKTYERSTLDLDQTQREYLLRALEGPELAELNARAQPGAGAFDPSDGISLAEAEAIALVFNRDLRTARLAAGVTQASADNAGLWRDPVLGVDLTKIVSGASQGVEAIVSVGFTLPISGRLELEKNRLGAEHAAELARVAALEWNTIAALRRAWTERAGIARAVEATRDVLQRVEQVTAIVDRMEQAGELARIEARLFRIEDAKLRSRLALLESDLARASHAVEAILDLPPTAGRVFSGEFASSARLAPESRDAAFAAIRDTNPAVLVARADYEIAERTLEKTLVPLVEAQYAETREVARLGEVKTLVLLESLKQQLEARNEMIAARRDEALAAIDIDELLGPPQQAKRDEGSQP